MATVATVTGLSSSAAASVANTTAIHIARDSVGVGGVIYIPGGTWYVTEVKANTASQRWILHPTAVLKSVAGGSGVVFYVTAAEVTIEGGCLDNNRTNVIGGACVYAPTTTPAGLKVIGVWLKDSFGYGIQAEASRTVVRNCRVTGSGSTGILIDAGAGDVTDCEVAHNEVDRSTEPALTVDGSGIQVRGGGAPSPSTAQYRARVIGNTVKMPGNPADVIALCIEAGGRSHYATIQGNTCIQGSMGISLDNSNHCSVVGNTIWKPTCVSGSYGIELASSSYNSVVGNTVNAATVTDRGIACTNTGSIDNTITGNVIKDTVSVGIEAGNSSHLRPTITGNVVDVATGYGIRIAGATGAVVSGNNLNGQTAPASSKGISLETVSEVTVTGNQIRLFEQGLLIFASTAVTLDRLVIAGNLFRSNGTDRVNTLSGGAALNANTLATTATTGFLQIPSCAGTPTGTPVAESGVVPMIWDSTNHKLYVYSGGAWKGGTGPGAFS